MNQLVVKHVTRRHVLVASRLFALPLTMISRLAELMALPSVIVQARQQPTPIECPQEGNRILNVLSSCFEKPTSAQNGNEDVQRTSSEIDKKPSFGLRLRKRRQDPQHSKNIYAPAIPSSRNAFASRQTRASARKALSQAPRTSPARPC
jgi:hypothetical protein